MARKRRNRSEIGELLDRADADVSALTDSEVVEDTSPPPATARTAKKTRVRILKKRVRGRNGIYELNSELSLGDDEAGELIEKGLAALA